MGDYSDWKESFVNSGTHSTVNSDEISDRNSTSPPLENLTKQKSLNIPSIKTETIDDYMSKPVDIKKQLSQSFQGSNSLSYSGGISKPRSRKNSLVPTKSEGSDDENEDGDGQGNERKRRDNINEKIQELLTLVPVEFFQENPSVQQGQQNDTNNSQEATIAAAIAAAVKNSGTKDGKPNKGQILTKSVNYIQYLQNLIDENNRKEVELMMNLKNLELKNDGKENDPNDSMNMEHTSGEKALGEIGVGPLSEEYFKQVLLESSNQRRSSIG